MKLETLIESCKKFNPEDKTLTKLVEFSSEINVTMSSRYLMDPEFKTYEPRFRPKTHQSFLKFKKVFNLPKDAFKPENIIKEHFNRIYNLEKEKALLYPDLYIEGLNYFNSVFIRLDQFYRSLHSNKFEGKINNKWSYKIYPEIPWQVYFKETERQKFIKKICEEILKDDYKEMLLKYNIKKKLLEKSFKINLKSMVRKN